MGNQGFPVYASFPARKSLAIKEMRVSLARFRAIIGFMLVSFAHIAWEQARVAQPANGAEVGGIVPANSVIASADPEPLPDIPALMRQVELNQRNAETVEKTYIFRSVATEEAIDSRGKDKKITTVESDQFWLDGVPVRRVLRKNGLELSANELAKQDREIEKQVKEATERRAKYDAQGKETDPEGHEEITVSRLLELGAFTNARRVELNGRSTIAVDYTGDPHAKTHNRGEDAVREMAGTAWIDEQDKVLSRVEGRFAHAFKVGAGLVVNIKEGTHFTFEQTKVNDEVWLPARIDAEGAARVMLFVSFSGKIRVVDSDFRKFRTSTRILPGVTPVEPSSH